MAGPSTVQFKILLGFMHKHSGHSDAVIMLTGNIISQYNILHNGVWHPGQPILQLTTEFLGNVKAAMFVFCVATKYI